MTTVLLRVQENWSADESVQSKVILRQKLNQFLSGVERPAFRMAFMSVRIEAEALDIVQDSMMRFASSYSKKPEAEWAPLFYRVLNNRMTDYHRKATVRKRWQAFFGRSTTDSEGFDIIEQSIDQYNHQPQDALAFDQFGTELELALKNLPLRQRQAFLLRTWQEFSVAETAQAMGCSEGSVKTHLSRALKSLRSDLGECNEQ
ncbi:MAG: RNA polymerase sigma factor [bacterium]